MSIIDLIPGLYFAASVLWVLSLIVIIAGGISFITIAFANKKLISMNIIFLAGIVHALTIPFAGLVAGEAFLNTAFLILLAISGLGALTCVILMLRLIRIKKETGQQDK